METYIDIHSHILQCVDDGSDSLEMSMEMLHIAADEGISQILLTPHNKPGHKRGELSVTAPRLEELRNKLISEKLDMKLYLGNELYYRRGLCEEIECGRAATLAGSHYVLIEFGPLDDYEYIRNGIYDMLMNGYRPILAHVERYRNVCAQMTRVGELIEMGCCMQINAGSIMGKFGFSTKQISKKLLKQHFVQFIATDAHDPDKRAPLLADCGNYVSKKFGRDYSQKIFYDNPMCILQDKYITDWKER